MPIEAKKAAQIRSDASKAVRGRAWLSCEPVHFCHDETDGHLAGRSKPNFAPHPDDVVASRAENLPDGTIADVLRILGDISWKYGIDWEFSHNAADGPVGYIRKGVIDSTLRIQIKAFDELCGMFGDFEDELDDAMPRTFNESASLFDSETHQQNHDGEADDDDYDGPATIKMWPE